MLSLVPSKNKSYETLIEKATSNLLLEPDWSANMIICDAVRGQDITPKFTIAVVKKRMTNENPHVVVFSLHLLEALVKNCGALIIDEIATQEFMDFMKDLLRNRDVVKAKVLELIQIWAHAFRKQSKYRIFEETYAALKKAGNTFPPLRDSDAMFSLESAPDWKLEGNCYRCKVAFGTFNRRHHCRNCGNSVCAECSNKRSIIPKFGIEKEVRVCDTCYDALRRIAPAKETGESESPKLSRKPEASVPQSGTTEDRERELRLREEEELNLALAISASEAEAETKERERSRYRQHPQQQTGQSNSSPGHLSLQPSQAPTTTGANQPRVALYSSLDTSEMDPELARYLNRNYWEALRSSGLQPSAPPGLASPSPQQSMKTSDVLVGTGPDGKSKPNPTFDQNGQIDPSATTSDGDEIPAEEQQFLNALRSSIEILMNRMRSNSQRGRSIANDSAVQTLFLTLDAMRPQLLHYVKKQEDARTYYESLQDKLTHLREAREALDALRLDHSERRRREEEEAARQRHIQMMQKLEVMRQKKQEYLDYQRQLALQRMQEQEREMAVRLEQQKQMMQMRQYQQQYPYSVQQAGQQYPQQVAAGPGPVYQGYPGQTAGYVQMPGSYQSMVPQGMPDQYQHAVPPAEYYTMQAGMPQGHSAPIPTGTMGLSQQQGHPGNVPVGPPHFVPPQAVAPSGVGFAPYPGVAMVTGEQQAAPTGGEPYAHRPREEQLISFD